MTKLVPLPPLETALPIPGERGSALLALLGGLDASALAWVSGYAAGLAAARAGEAAPGPVARASAATALTIAYGSQTGNARRIAERLRERALTEGLAARLVNIGQLKPAELARERALVVVISTHGDGDPPDDARAFLEALHSRRAPDLARLGYAVLALGDSSYPKFCAVGRSLDARLAELGGQRLFELGECDVDFETVAASWIERALVEARNLLGRGAAAATVTPLRAQATPAPTRERPFAAEVLANQRITARDARKDVRHLELALADSGLVYEPGDALGVRPRNPAALVERVLAAARLDGGSLVERDGRRAALAEWLASEREITRLSRPFLAAHATRGPHAELKQLLDGAPGEAFARLLRERQLLDVLLDWPVAWEPDTLVAALRPMAPRLYSIASSRKRVGDEAHLTVAVVGYEAFGRRHVGAASSQLAALDTEGGLVEVYLEPNERFRLPADPARDVLMIGAGTGVAPYRGFVQERAEIGARGRHWLVFGEQHFDSTFLYQAEWLEALERGELQRLDLAFSRDQPERIHVQQRLRERARDVYAWLENGAHLYVCGDATRMAPDVHRELVEIVATQRGVDQDAAQAYLAELLAVGRYARDVY